MGSREKNQKPLLDFLSKSDDSWYTIRPLVLDSYKETLIVKYWDFAEDFDECFFVHSLKTLEELEDFKKRFRPACVQLQDKECKDVQTMMNVCCSFIQGDEEEVKFYNGVIDSISRKPHAREGRRQICECSFVVAWLHGPMAGTKESMGIERICKLKSGTPLVVDRKLADFVSMVEAQLKLPSNDSDYSEEDVE
ncbi:hypothetical protein MKW94_013775, partial [Papaver nudicaule]|nr:hypothetical protein [Papaver nudicaule]